MKKHVLFIMMLPLLAVLLAGCGNNAQKPADTAAINAVKAPYQKKYTNADFYNDGKLDAEVALAAYVDMMDYYGVPYSDFLKENLFISDFELGDFENVGMAGVFWVHDLDNGYFGHEIYLLPGQMIGEHKHIPAAGYPAKIESWQVRHGWAYNVSDGEPTPNPPALPESQKGNITIANFKVQNVDEILHLTAPEAKHFLYAGPEGVIVTEYANWHHGDGLVFTNGKAVFTDVLADK